MPARQGNDAAGQRLYQLIRQPHPIAGRQFLGDLDAHQVAVPMRHAGSALSAGSLLTVCSLGEQ